MSNCRSVFCSFNDMCYFMLTFFFFFNDTATTEIYTLSLHDALPICNDPRDARDQGDRREPRPSRARDGRRPPRAPARGVAARDRKSTRLNSSHANISYAVFCLKKKKTQTPPTSSQKHPSHEFRDNSR